VGDQGALQDIHAVGTGMGVPHVDNSGGVANQADLHAGVRVGDQVLAVQGPAQLLVEPLLPGQGGRVDGNQLVRIHNELLDQGPKRSADSTLTDGTTPEPACRPGEYARLGPSSPR